MTSHEFRQGVESLWDKVNQGWTRLRESTAGALTRFRPGQATELPAAADIDVPTGLGNPGWGLVGGDVFEDDRRVLVRLELPGMERKDFDIEVRGDTLTVRGEKRFEREQTEGRWRVLQCAYGSFSRVVALPARVDSAQASAVYKDGVLKIELPKVEPARPTAVTIPVA